MHDILKSILYMLDEQEEYIPNSRDERMHEADVWLRQNLSEQGKATLEQLLDDRSDEYDESRIRAFRRGLLLGVRLGVDCCYEYE